MKPRIQSFGQTAKIRLIERGMTVTTLARRIGYGRCNVSLTIHGTRRFPTIEAAIRKELGL